MVDQIRYTKDDSGSELPHRWRVVQYRWLESDWIAMGVLQYVRTLTHACHNFRILTAQSTTATKTTFTEIRRTPKSPWYTETVLPDSSLALPATDIACTIANKTISLYYQDHDMNIKHWLNENNTWSGKLLLRTAFRQ